MTPEDFIDTWKGVELTERQASQSHFIDLCSLLGIDPPVKADPKGEWFTFEVGIKKGSGGKGWADVWRDGHFGWEYKGLHADLDAALDQLRNYAQGLKNPPLLIVSDMNVIKIHTNWNNTVSEVHTIYLDDLKDAKNRDLLENAFRNPALLKPTTTRDMVTEKAAKNFTDIAQRLRDRGHPPEKIAHFINRLVFCMFAEDVNLLPNKIFEKLVKKTPRSKPSTFETYAKDLFSKMKTGGIFGLETIDWFNGGLFDSDEALPLEWQDLDDLKRATFLDWSDIDPVIFGTLFERGLDPQKRSQLGAHYTSNEKIMQIVEPLIVEPLISEWQETKEQIEGILGKAPTAPVGTKAKSAETRAIKKAEKLHDDFIERLKDFRVLDPACGSGNFLYTALLELKNIEHLANIEAEALGLQKKFPQVGPEAVLGIELSGYAAELARITVWIGEIQWMRRNGFAATKNPILRTLKTIENRDAILAEDGSKAKWPEANVVIGNPPFIGNKVMKNALTVAYVENLRAAYPDTGSVDFVVYWFEKAWQQIEDKKLMSVGLVATNSIRGGANRKILEKISKYGTIFEAWSDEPWLQEGAAVRVSIICFDKEKRSSVKLDGKKTSVIYSDLKTNDTGVDVTNALPIPANLDHAFQGTIKTGPFDISGITARNLIRMPINPNGKENIDVVKPWINGKDITDRHSDTWIIDFGSMSKKEAALYTEPYKLLKAEIAKKNLKLKKNGTNELRAGEKNRKLEWHQLQRPRPEMRKALLPLKRYIATPRVAKHRIFIFVDAVVLPDTANVIIAREDFVTFGILNSIFHQTWSLAQCTYLGKGNDPRYSHKATFETFPFPDGLSPNIPASAFAKIHAAKDIEYCAKQLDDLRNNWLNPSSQIIIKADLHPSLPDLKKPKDAKSAQLLKDRTLTKLYNEMPDWLINAHNDLDAAVANAYNWGKEWNSSRFDDQEIISRLFSLNAKNSIAHP